MMLTFFLKMDKLSLATTLNVISDSLIWTRHWILKHVSKYTIILSFPLLWQLNQFLYHGFVNFRMPAKFTPGHSSVRGKLLPALPPQDCLIYFPIFFFFICLSFMAFSFNHNHIEFDVLTVHWFFPQILSPISSHSLLGWKISLISSKNISFIDFQKNCYEIVYIYKPWYFSQTCL